MKVYIIEQQEWQDDPYYVFVKAYINKEKALAEVEKMKNEDYIKEFNFKFNRGYGKLSRKEYDNDTYCKSKFIITEVEAEE